MRADGSKYYFSRLSADGKMLYERMCRALLDFEPVFSVQAPKGKPFRLDVEDVLEAVIFDNPVFFYLNRESIGIRQSPRYIQICFEYNYTKERADALWARVLEEIERFVSERITPSMTPLQKQLEIHRYITSFEYAAPPYKEECFSVVGAFLDKRCVCEGFSKAYKMLCDRVKIASIVAVGEGISPDGTGERHAWNITRINGVTAHTDATWDARYGVSNYDYFNLCDAEILADHRYPVGKYPACNPNKINYFYKNGLIAHDKQQLLQLILENESAPRYSIKLVFKLDASCVPYMPFGEGKISYNESQNIITFFKS